MRKATRPAPRRSMDGVSTGGTTFSGGERIPLVGQNGSMDGIASGGAMSGTGEKRKPATAEEAALTAKNYRLAKELSELRVRHRDETKSVTRLTMENMNLTSRYREALSTITTLKKELSIHQKKSAELLAVNKQYVEKYGIQDSSLNGTASGQDAAEAHDAFLSFRTKGPMMDVAPKTAVDESMSQNHVASSKESSLKPKNVGVDVKTVNHGMMSQATTARNHSSKHHDKKIPDQKSEKDHSSKKISTSGVLVPNPISESIRADDNEAAFGELYSTDFFHHSFKSNLASMPERDFPTDASSTENKSDAPHTNNFDAFDNSFSTSFPSSFSSFVTTPSTTSSSMDVAFDVHDFSDPFFLGVSHEARGKSGTETFSRNSMKQKEGSSTSSGNRTHSPIPSKSHRTSTKRDKSSTSSHNSMNDSASQNLFPTLAIDMFESSSSHEEVSMTRSMGKATSEKQVLLSPIHSHNTTTIAPSSTSQGVRQEPPPPPPLPSMAVNSDKSSPKINISASRARFDAARSNRLDIGERLLELKLADESPSKHEQMTSYSTKRMQQRMFGESAVDDQTSTDSFSISDEIRRLDEIAAGVLTPSPISNDEILNNEKASKSRRAVKQPISYAEPSIQSKLRRGDVFFPKHEYSESESKENRLGEVPDARRKSKLTEE